MNEFTASKGVTKRHLPSVKKSLSSSGSETGGDPAPTIDAEEDDPLDETLTVIIGTEEEEDDVDMVQEIRQELEDKSPSPETISNATENVLYQEIPLVRSKDNSPPVSTTKTHSVDDYAEPHMVISSPLPSTHSSISSNATIPISTNGSPLYAQVHKEPRTEIQKIHSTIPNTFKNDNMGCLLTTFGTKTPSMTSFGNNSTPMSSLGAASGQTSSSRTQLLAASYSNDLNSSKDSILGSTDMLSDSGNHSDSWIPGGRKRISGRAPPSSFTEQLNQVLAGRERCVDGGFMTRRDIFINCINLKPVDCFIVCNFFKCPPL